MTSLTIDRWTDPGVGVQVSGDSELADVGNVSGLEWAHLLVLQGDQGHRAAIIADKLHLEGHAIPMYQNRSAHVPALETVSGQIARQRHGIQFFGSVHNFGSGCAVTKRCVSLPVSLYQAQRILKTLPSGAFSGPSTT